MVFCSFDHVYFWYMCYFGLHGHVGRLHTYVYNGKGKLVFSHVTHENYQVWETYTFVYGQQFEYWIKIGSMLILEIIIIR